MYLIGERLYQCYAIKGFDIYPGGGVCASPIKLNFLSNFCEKNLTMLSRDLNYMV